MWERGPGTGRRKEEEEEEEEKESRDQVTNQADQHHPCVTWFSSPQGDVNKAEAAAGEAALHTSGLASGSCRCSGSCHISVPLGFRLLKCHSSSVSRIDVFTCTSQCIPRHCQSIWRTEGSQQSKVSPFVLL